MLAADLLTTGAAHGMVAVEEWRRLALIVKVHHLMAMSRILFGLVLVLGCPKEKRRCVPIELTIEAGAGGGDGLVAEDVCGLEDGEWWEFAPSLFSMELPTHLYFEFSEVHPNASPLLSLFVRAETHAPAGIVETTYRYQTSLSASEDPSTGPVRIRVTLPPGRHNLVVATSGSGGVTNSHINCSATADRCAASFSEEEAVDLVAAPDPGWELVRVDGCSDLALAPQPNGTTQVTGPLTADRSCTIVFEPASGNARLDVSVEGAGGVLVGGEATACTGACAYARATGTTVTLTAQGTPNGVFDSWGGACAGQGSTATIVLDADKACVARFADPNVEMVPLTIEVDGEGTVIVEGRGECALPSCSYSVGQGQTVTLTANPNVEFRYHFARWEGDCSGTSVSIEVPMNAATMCRALFETSGRDCTQRIDPSAGWIEVYDGSNNLLGMGSSESVVVNVPYGTQVTLKADGFVSNTGSPLLVYDWVVGGPFDGTGFGQQFTFDSGAVSPGQYAAQVTATDADCGNGAIAVSILYNLQ